MANTAPILDPEGNALGAVGIFQDITARKQIEGELRRNAVQGKLLARLSQTFVEAGQDYDAMLNMLAHGIAESLREGCAIHLVSADGRWLNPVALDHPDAARIAPLSAIFGPISAETDGGPAGRVFRSGEALLVPFIPWSDSQGAGPQEFWHGADEDRLYSALVVPMRVGRGSIGTLTVFRIYPFEPLTADDQVFFQDLADRASLAVENAGLYAAQAQRAQEIDALHRATEALHTTLDLETLLNQILDAAMSAVPAAESGALRLVADDTGELQLRAATGDLSPPLEHSGALSNQDPALLAVRERRPLLIAQTRAETGAQDRDLGGGLPAPGSAVVAPLVLGESVLGVLSLEASQPGAFSETDLRLLASFAATTTTAIRNATLHSEIQRQAVTDSGTGIYNRRGFFEFGRREIERTRRFGHPLCAIMLDIDYFKRVNDAHTHVIGDQVLQGLARRLRENLREVDILGRFGGEEFAILLPETDLVTAIAVAERLRLWVEEHPFPTDHGPLFITVSLGVSVADLGSLDLNALLEQADVALYAAKQDGRNRVEVR